PSFVRCTWPRAIASPAAPSSSSLRSSLVLLEHEPRRLGRRKPCSGDRLRRLLAARVPRDRADELVAVEPVELDVGRSSDRRGSRDVVEKRDLAEVLARALAPDRRAVDAHLDLAPVDDVEPVARFSLAEDLVSGGDLDRDEARGDLFDPRRP